MFADHVAIPIYTQECWLCFLTYGTLTRGRGGNASYGRLQHRQRLGTRDFRELELNTSSSSARFVRVCSTWAALAKLIRNLLGLSVAARKNLIQALMPLRNLCSIWRLRCRHGAVGIHDCQPFSPSQHHHRRTALGPSGCTRTLVALVINQDAQLLHNVPYPPTSCEPFTFVLDICPKPVIPCGGA